MVVEAGEQLRHRPACRQAVAVRLQESLLQRVAQAFPVQLDAERPRLFKEALDLLGIVPRSLEGAAEVHVEHELGGGGERSGERRAEAAQEAHQRRVMREDVAELVLHLVQGRGQDEVEDAALLVPEERLQGVGDAAEIAVEQPDDVRAGRRARRRPPPAWAISASIALLALVEELTPALRL